MKPVKLPVNRYYANINEWIELGKTATNAFYANFKNGFDHVHKNIGYVKINGYEYRIDLSLNNEPI